MEVVETFIFIEGGVYMKLDHECVRYVLLALESLNRNESLETYNYQSIDYLSNFDSDTVTYTIEKLDEAGFINADIISSLGGDHSFYATSLTWDGHQLLDNIRDDKVWKETKSVASKVGSASLEILSNIASSVLHKMLGLS